MRCRRLALSDPLHVWLADRKSSQSDSWGSPELRSSLGCALNSMNLRESLARVGDRDRSSFSQREKLHRGNTPTRVARRVRGHYGTTSHRPGRLNPSGICVKTIWRYEYHFDRRLVRFPIVRHRLPCGGFVAFDSSDLVNVGNSDDLTVGRSSYKSMSCHRKGLAAYERSENPPLSACF